MTEISVGVAVLMIIVPFFIGMVIGAITNSVADSSAVRECIAYLTLRSQQKHELELARIKHGDTERKS